MADSINLFVEAFDEKRHTQPGQSNTIVRTLTFFLVNVFFLSFNMLSQCLVPSITKKTISYSLVLGQLRALQIQSFQCSILVYPKMIRNFF